VEISLKPVTELQKKLLVRLLAEYQSELLGSGAAEYKYLDSYWTKPDRHAHFITVDEEICGFVLVNKYAIVLEDAHSIAEFYIAPAYRGQGIGQEAARQIFQLFPGPWEVRQLRANSAARAFWLKVIADLVGKGFMEHELRNADWDGWAQTFSIGNSV
jgi:predicted acetyltransferase